MHWLSSLVIGASAVNALTATNTFCYDTQNTFCVAATRDNMFATFTVYSSVTGWAAIGTGQQMAGSTMFVGFAPIGNGTNSVMSQRSSQGTSVVPLYNPKPIFTQSLNATFAVPATTMSFTFKVPLSQNLIDIGKPASYIFAVSQNRPSNASNPTSSFPQHSLSGTFQLDLSTVSANTTITTINSNNFPAGNGVTATDESTYERLILIHAVCMVLAWAVAVPIAVFIARYMKYKWGHKWYLAHAGIMIFGVGGLTAAGLLAVELSLDEGAPRFFTHNHAIIGTVVALMLYPLQVILGFVSNALFDSLRDRIPLIDKVHWWIGRGTGILALVNIHLGLLKYEASVGWFIAFWVWVGLVVLILFGYVGEQVIGGAVHHSVSDLTLPPRIRVERLSLNLRSYSSDTSIKNWFRSGSTGNFAADLSRSNSTRPVQFANPPIPTLPVEQEYKETDYERRHRLPVHRGSKTLGKFLEPDAVFDQARSNSTTPFLGDN